MCSDAISNPTSNAPPRCFVVDRLNVEVHPDRRSLGRAAARAAAAYLRGVIASQGSARVVFACAPSQDEFLAALADPTVSGVKIDWSRLMAFHMDEYVGLGADHPQCFRQYLKSHLLARVPVGGAHLIPAEEADLPEVCRAYAERLAEAPIDLVCLGVGENGHIAFNDPPVADFSDPVLVKVVELDEACRRQQVNDGCFPSLAQVPRRAFTITVPVFIRARRLSIHVPGRRKSAAVRSMLRDPISTACPATILRAHPSARLFLDPESASAL
jgi:glucosamine-6-phosphate deaminase